MTEFIILVGNAPIKSRRSLSVGKTGFEPATPWSQTRCATGLRYFPNIICADQLLTHSPPTLPISIGMRYRPALLPEYNMCRPHLNSFTSDPPYLTRVALPFCAASAEYLVLDKSLVQQSSIV